MPVPHPDGVVWFKSSYSSGTSNECVEVAWFKSSYSSSPTNECVEVAHLPEAVGVRDTKDRDGGTLTVPAAAWATFTTHLTIR
ncbi:DUF397 domain-containing protein [Amycolatopsis sp. NPDC059021]|uniref:DUF397 domain-containing protein n=1 Tax=Amycolatopsis sp. NPDC059021 TaxID=3346704 RepID=UPI00366F46AE